MAGNAKSLLEKISPEDATHKMNASLQLLRYIIALEEEVLQRPRILFVGKPDTFFSLNKSTNITAAAFVKWHQDLKHSS